MSDVQYKFILVLFEDQNAKQERYNAKNDAEEIRLWFKRNAVDQDTADKAQNVVERIELVHRHKLRGNDVFGIEDRGQVHQKHREDAPKELCITEEHHHGCKDQSNAVAEQEEHQKHKGKQKNGGGNGGTRHQHHNKEGNQREQQIDARGERAREGVDIFGHVHLVDQGGVAHDAHQAHAGGFAEEVVADEYYNIALFGVDARTDQLDAGVNSDSIIVASINKTNNSFIF